MWYRYRLAFAVTDGASPQPRTLVVFGDSLNACFGASAETFARAAAGYAPDLVRTAVETFFVGKLFQFVIPAPRTGASAAQTGATRTTAGGSGKVIALPGGRFAAVARAAARVPDGMATFDSLGLSTTEGILDRWLFRIQFDIPIETCPTAAHPP